MQTRNASDAKGIDVSEYQGTIDWGKVAQAGISFAYIKATEGLTLVDNMLAQNFSNAKQAGILRGAYCYAHPGAGSAVAQANYFVETLKSHGGFGELPPALDLEDNGGLDSAALTTWVEDWMNQVQHATGKKPILYTYPAFADSNLQSSLAQNIPIWIANYGVNEPENAAGWSTWTFWQYSDTGAVPGITGNVDLDVYAGTVNELVSTTGPASKETNYTLHHVFVLDHPYQAISVGDVTYVIWTALNTLGTPHIYKGSGVMSIDGKDVQGVVYQGNTYLPWASLAPGIKAERIFHFYTDTSS